MCTYRFVAKTHTGYYLPALLDIIGVYHAPQEFLGELLVRGDHKGFIQVVRIAGYTAKVLQRGNKRTYRIIGTSGSLKIVERRTKDDLGVMCRDVTEVTITGGNMAKDREIPPQFLERTDCGDKNCPLSDSFED